MVMVLQFNADEISYKQMVVLSVSPLDRLGKKANRHVTLTVGKQPVVYGTTSKLRPSSKVNERPSKVALMVVLARLKARA